MIKVGLVFLALLLSLTGCGRNEIAGCNDDSVKATLMMGTWEKQRSLLLGQWHCWPAPGSEDTELGVLMEPEVRHGAAEVYARVQA